MSETGSRESLLEHPTTSVTKLTVSVPSLSGKINSGIKSTELTGVIPGKCSVTPGNVGQPHIENKDFQNISPEDLVNIVKAYTARTYDEDLKCIVSLTNSNAKPIERLCELLKTSPEGGISCHDPSELELREAIFGGNGMPLRKSTPFWRLVYDASNDFVLRILMVSGIVSLALGLTFGERKDIEWIDGAAIFLAVLIVVLVTAGNDYLKEKKFAALGIKNEKLCSVIRDGIVHELPIDNLLVGDIVMVETGDEIAADCLILNCREFSLDESSMTGESRAVKKASLSDCERIQKDLERTESNILQTLSSGTTHHLIPSPIALSGSIVMNGSGTLMVIAAGLNSQAGQLLEKLTVDTDPTPLQNKLNALARDIGTLGLIAAVFTFLVYIIQYWIIFGFQSSSDQSHSTGTILSSHVDFLVEAITILVVAIPEGLPLAVTISLAFSVGRMLKDHNYVRRLAACETMGGASEICSDKTGTLTKNCMSVQAFWNGSRLTETDTVNPSILPVVIESASPPLHPNDHLNLLKLPQIERDIFSEAVSLNSTAHLEIGNETNPLLTGDQNRLTNTRPLSYRSIGSPTESALLQMLLDCGYDYEKIRKTRGTDNTIIHRIPFNSNRKLMTTVVIHPTSPHLYRVYVKGAAEILLRLCRYRIDSSGQFKPMETIHINRIEKQIIDHMAGQGLRTICIAYKDFNPQEEPNWKDPVPLTHPIHSTDTYRQRAVLSPQRTPGKLDGLIFYHMELELMCLGVAGMRDPVREEVPAAVRRCQDAGIRVRMITGDNLETAKQIAIKCHIYHPETGGIALTGPDFYRMIGGVVCSLCQTETCLCPVSGTSLANQTQRAFVSQKLKKKKKENVPLRIPQEPLPALQSGDYVLTTTASGSPGSTTDPRVSTRHSKDYIQHPATDIPSPPSQASGHRQTCCFTCGWRFNRHTNGIISPQNEMIIQKKPRVDVIKDMAAFARIADKLEVLARSQPRDKYAVVLGLKTLGAVVAVTGDGTNDAPALKKADVGFAMGLSGKEVAKQAADIVLLDDNFESIVKAVKWGRNIYDNIRRFLQFQLTVNIVAVSTAVVGSLVLRESPLNAVQLLWVNLIMDTFASLALATEPPTEFLLDRPPHSRNEYLVNKIMTRNILGQAAYQLTIMMILIFTGECWIPETSSPGYQHHNDFSEFSKTCGNGHTVTAGRRFKPFSHVEVYKKKWTSLIGPSRHYTVVFNTFVFLQVFNLINARKVNNEWNVFSRVLSSSLWLIIIAIICVGQIILVEFGGHALNCHLNGLTWQQWLISIGLGMGGLVVGFFLHLLPAEKILFLPQAGNKESDILSASTNFALASRGRMSTDRLSSRLASGLHNEGRRRPIISPNKSFDRIPSGKAGSSSAGWLRTKPNHSFRRQPGQGFYSAPSLSVTISP